MVNAEIRLIIFFAAEDGEALQSAKTRTGADCGSDHEFFIAKFRLKLKKVGKTTRPFNYDVNPLQLYSGSELDRVPEELWTEVHEIYRRQ